MRQPSKTCWSNSKRRKVRSAGSENTGSRRSARLALDYYRTFDEPLPAVPDPDPENPKSIGAWALLHDLLVQCGYHWYDETDIALRMLRNRLKSIAAYQGADAAREEYERIRSAWLEHEAELEDWLDEAPTGTMSEP